MAAELGLSLPKSNGGNGYGKPDATAGEKPQIYNWGDSGPPQRSDEIRRHCYSVSGCAMKIKIKFRGDRFTQWYRAFRDDVPIGWHSGPTTTSMSPTFPPRLIRSIPSCSTSYSTTKFYGPKARRTFKA